MGEYRISSADIAIRCDATIDDLIDVLEAKSRRYIPVIYALNKIDAVSIEELDLLYRIPNACPISAEHGWNLDELLEMMWDRLSLRRIYTKPKGKLPDYSSPVVLRSTAGTVEDFVRARPAPSPSSPLSPLFSRGRVLELTSSAVQRHPQEHRRTVQARDRVRILGQASTTASGPDARTSGRGHQ